MQLVCHPHLRQFPHFLLPKTLSPKKNSHLQVQIEIQIIIELVRAIKIINATNGTNVKIKIEPWDR